MSLENAQEQEVGGLPSQPCGDAKSAATEAQSSAVDHALSVMDQAIEKIEELRAERDSAIRNWKALQKCVDDADLAQLFDDLTEFLDNQADADGDSEGFYPNKAMRLSSAVASAARALGWEV
jgi:hypothetical protein